MVEPTPDGNYLLTIKDGKFFDKLTLSEEEMRWCRAYRAMDDDTRKINIFMMKRQAERHPLETGPSLHLVARKKP